MSTAKVTESIFKRSWMGTSGNGFNAWVKRWQ